MRSYSDSPFTMSTGSALIFRWHANLPSWQEGLTYTGLSHISFSSCSGLLGCGIELLGHDRLWTNGLQHARLPCPPLSSGVCSSLYPLSQWCNLTFSSSAFFLLVSIFPSIRVFSNESVLCIRWPKYWSFSFSISPSNEYLGLISFRTDWFNLLAAQGNLKSLIQNHTLKASILGHSDFLMIRLSHLYMTTGKTICCSVTQLCPTLFNPMDCCMSGFLVLHYLPEFTQIMSIESVIPDTIQPSHPLSPPSPPAFYLS